VHLLKGGALIQTTTQYLITTTYGLLLTLKNDILCTVSILPDIIPHNAIVKLARTAKHNVNNTLNCNTYVKKICIPSETVRPDLIEMSSTVIPMY